MCDVENYKIYTFVGTRTQDHLHKPLPTEPQNIDTYLKRILHRESKKCKSGLSVNWLIMFSFTAGARNRFRLP